MNAFAHYSIIIASPTAVVNSYFMKNAGFFEKVAKILKLSLDKSEFAVYNATRKDKGVLSDMLEASFFISAKEKVLWQT